MQNIPQEQLPYGHIGQDQRASVTLVQRLAVFFRSRPNEWHCGLTLGTIAGSYAWRSRCSDFRRPPHNMTIANRQRRLRRTSDGAVYIISEYCFVLGNGSNAA
jgi:hypothetical protein